MLQERSASRYRGSGKLLGQVFVEPGGDPGLGQIFGQQEHVGRAASRDRRHRIKKVFGFDPGKGAHRRKQARGKDALVLADGGAGAGHGHAVADGRGRIRHGADDGGVGSQVSSQGLNGASGGDGDEKRPRIRLAAAKSGVTGKRFLHYLRLDGEDHHLRRVSSFGKIGKDGKVIALTEGRGGVLLGFHHCHRGGTETVAEPAFKQGTSHLSAAHKKQGRGQRRHASPTVTRRAASMACSGVRPPHITSWKAG